MIMRLTATELALHNFGVQIAMLCSTSRLQQIYITYLVHIPLISQILADSVLQ